MHLAGVSVGRVQEPATEKQKQWLAELHAIKLMAIRKKVEDGV